MQYSAHKNIENLEIVRCAANDTRKLTILYLGSDVDYDVAPTECCEYNYFI